MCFLVGVKEQPVVIKGKIRLKDFDPGYSGGLDKEKTKEKMARDGQRIAELQELLYANSSHAVLLIVQGMDASGKDGSTRSVLGYVNPAGIETANFKVPSVEERAHDFLWRVHKAVPRYGSIGVFNRSHYEAVLAERVLKIVPTKVWSGRYAQIVAFERMLVENHVLLLKSYLHISKEEYARQFISDVVCHEVGHCLGLRHNFEGSTELTTAELADDSLTSRVGTTASVMDYTPVNIQAVLKGKGNFFMPTVGAYDVWAIQYGYETCVGAVTPSGIRRERMRPQ